jgi:RNA polymerase sigma factor (sigma-70 family)
VDRESSDTELLTAIRAGDDTAWAELVRRYAGRIWATARAQSLNAEQASDVVQTVWLVLLDKIWTIRNDESIRFWLTSVARHEAIRVSKAQRRLGDDTSLEYLADPNSEAGSDRVERSDVIVRMRQAMNRISARCRELWHLLFCETEYSYREIADLLERPVGSLGAQRARCLDELRGILGV